MAVTVQQLSDHIDQFLGTHVDLSSDALSDFIQDQSEASLYLVKSQDQTYRLTQGLSAGLDLSTPSDVVIILKGRGPIESLDSMITTRLPLCDYAESLDKLRYMISFVISACFDAMTRSQSSHSVAAVKKRVNELLLSLESLHETVETPNLLMTLHPRLADTELQSDSSFLNQVQEIASRWVTGIQKVISVSYDLAHGSVTNEINFWASKEAALKSIEDQLNDTSVQKSLDILKASKRFQAGLSFLSQSSIHESWSEASKNNRLLRDLPIQDVLAADDIPRLESATTAVFKHLRKLKVTQYPLDRAILLAEAVCRDINTRAQQILETRKLMALPYTEFDALQSQTSVLYETLDSCIQEMILLIRELLRKRSARFRVVKITYPQSLKERLAELAQLRSQHEELCNSTTKLSAILGMNPKLLLKDTSSAYEVFTTIDYLDSSPQFSAAINSYSQMVDTIEDRIIQSVRSAFAKKADDPYSVLDMFEEFAFLLQRPNVRNSVQDYQSDLVKVLQKELRSIEHQLKLQQQSKSIIAMHNLSNFASTVIWMQHLKEGLHLLVHRLELVLSRDWTQYPEGKQMSTQITSIDQQLSVDQFVRAWISKEMALIKSQPIDQPVLLQNLKVGLDDDAMDLANEIVNIQLLGYEVPKSVTLYAQQLGSVQPLALRLTESVASLQSIIDQSENLGDLKILLEPLLSKPLRNVPLLEEATWKDLLRANDLISANVSDVRETRALEAVKDFDDDVSELCKQYEQIGKARERLVKILPQFSVVPYTGFAPLISSLQSLLDDLFVAGFSDLDALTEQLNSTVKSILIGRCKCELSVFQRELSVDNSVYDMCTPETHQIVFRDMSIVVSPELEVTKKYWIQLLNTIITSVASQKKLQPNYIKVEVDVSSPDTFSSLLVELNKEYRDALTQAESLFQQACDYTSEWEMLQSLWDISFDDLKSDIGTDFSRWLATLQDLKRLRGIVDTVETTTNFGPLIIEYKQVQSRVSSQLDRWQRKASHELAGILQNEMINCDKQLADKKKSIESTRLSVASGSALTSACSLLYRSKMGIDSDAIDNYRQASSLLSQIRYRFPTDWVYFEQLSGTQQSLLQVIGRSLQALNSQLPIVQAKVDEEASSVLYAIGATKKSWRETIYAGNSDLSVDDAVQSLNKFDQMLEQLKDRAEMVSDTIALLSLNVKFDYNLDEIGQQLVELREIWGSIAALTGKVNGIRGTEWDLFVPRTAISTLDSILTQSRSMPVQVRRYTAFGTVQSSLKDVSRSIPLLAALKADAVTSAHMKQIFESLAGRLPPEPLTVGDVLDLDPKGHENYLKSVCQQAQTEKALSDSLLEIEQWWSTSTFELQEYDPGYMVVSSWSTLLERLNSDLGKLNSMQQSPLVSNFEVNVEQLEQKLSQLHDLLDTWIEVQREWTYLHGIFQKNEDIKALLPIESARLDNITAELFAMLNTAYRYPSVLSILSIPDIDATLHRVLDVLMRTKKSLVGYLETQREAFPRFFFVGNNDLLEIVGNATNVTVASKHIDKMFPGIATLHCDTDGNIVGIESPEGEKVQLTEPVPAPASELAADWLTCLDSAVKHTLSSKLSVSSRTYEDIWNGDFEAESLLHWINTTPNQIVILSMQLLWTSKVDQKSSDLQAKFRSLMKTLTTIVYQDLEVLERLKIENVIVEALHESEMLGTPDWWAQQRFYLQDGQVIVKQGISSLRYGFEYLGAPRSLVHTNLVNGAFLSMSETLDQMYGSSLVGPTGTGKTESVKALGRNLGRLVLVFCCDERFDYYAVSRILVGLCHLGSWGCFDEFNRLDANMLSAMATQIEKINGCIGSSSSSETDLLGKTVAVDKDTGIFITSNPDYAGRASLPDNLKSKYRTFSMVQPDSSDIAEAILTSQGFFHAHELSEKVVSLFSSLEERTSSQLFYDFGLRALKSTLLTCGRIKRQFGAEDDQQFELSVISSALHTRVQPRLISEDESIFDDVVSELPPTLSTVDESLVQALTSIAEKRGLSHSYQWAHKCTQLYDVCSGSQGIITLGAAGSGKSEALRCLMEAMKLVHSRENLTYSIDPKVSTKSELFGYIDYATSEWVDGVLTNIVRKVNEDAKGEKAKNVWIILDGDIDPQWVENLNSVLDDNRLLTLPNGERLSVSSNIRFIFEVDNLAHATPATISRCGIVWFGDSLFSQVNILTESIARLRSSRLPDEDRLDLKLSPAGHSVGDLKSILTDIVLKILTDDLLDQVSKIDIQHVMEPSVERSLSTLLAVLSTKLEQYISYLSSNVTLVSDDHTDAVKRMLVISIVVGYAGDSSLADSAKFCKELLSMDMFTWIKPEADLVYLDTAPSGEWTAFTVPEVTLEPHMIVQPDTVIPTLDTARTEEQIFSVLRQHKTVILCGPPGSGKTMLLMASLRRSAEYDCVGLNFSKDTNLSLLVDILEQHCVYKSTAIGTVLEPAVPGKWLVVFCDEINLPQPDEYDTQVLISFIREITTHGGFWSRRKKTWVNVSNVQFVGACNPPTDPGRYPLSRRFLRHSVVFMIDYPGYSSLSQIYLTFNTALLRAAPDLRGYATSLTNAMIEVYRNFFTHFNRSTRTHYIVSPRELTRWVRGMYIGIRESTSLDLDGLIRLWAYEGLGLFSDRLESTMARDWFFDNLKKAATVCFPYTDIDGALKQPILYSDWLSYYYQSVSETDLARYVEERLSVFADEEYDTQLTLHPDMLNHVVKVDRVLKSPQGHMILVGPSGSGKTTLTRFVAWMNGFKTIKLNVTADYKLEDFDAALRDLLLRAGANGEKVCFIIDESTVLSSSFLERMNTLLANSEIPGLFDGDDFKTLMDSASQAAQQVGLYLSNEDELYSWFTKQVAQNLHVVFTVSDLDSPDCPQMISSPALYNRCHLDWMGEWSKASLVKVASDYTEGLPLDKSDYDQSMGSYRIAVINSLVHIYNSVQDLKGEMHLVHCASPAQFISLLKNFESIFVEKDRELRQYHTHIQVGLDRLKEAFLNVNELRRSLQEKSDQLELKDKQARATLDKMLEEQNEAERKEEASVEIQRLLKSQDRNIQERKKTVLSELSEVQPLVEEAQRGVSNIKKQHLTEMRSMNHPPEAVQLTLESVCVLLGYEVSNWRDVQSVIRRDDFISSIVDFTGENLPSDVYDYMVSHYLSNPNYNYESVNRASKACGPLLLWVEAQLRYVAIIEKVEPLRSEMLQVEQKSVDTKNKLVAIDGMVKDLRQSIEESKASYSQLIRDTENLKIQIKDVESKVCRSTKLLEGLKEEKERWQGSIGKFEQQRDDLIGNVVLIASFMTFACAYDEGYRNQLWQVWSKDLECHQIQFDRSLSFASYLIKHGNTLQWEKNGLPNDELFIQNTAVLTTDDRHSLLIDPSGLMVDFLKHENDKLVVSSFLDKSYLRQLEGCVQFGGSILLMDGDHYDPAVNAIVANDTQSTGGRTLVKIGDKSIDISPNFQLFIHTKDPAVRIQSFLSARLSVLNFTFTAASLRRKALHLTIKSERPDLEEQRLQLMKANGELQEQLLNSENELLDCLGESKDRILENETLLNRLIELKADAQSIKIKLESSKNLVEESDSVMAAYKPLTTLYSRFTSLVSTLWKLNTEYEFGHEYVTTILSDVLREYTGKSVEVLVERLAASVYATLVPSLVQADWPVLGVLVYSLFKSISEQKLCLSPGEDNLSGLLNDYLRLTNEKVQRHDISAKQLDVIVSSSDFILLRCAEGFDATVKVSTLAKSLSQRMTVYSVGSNESVDTATTMIREAARQGNWIVIQNIHMSTKLKDLIPKIFDSLEKADMFKLFLTAPVDAKIGAVLCRKTVQVVFESEPGLKQVLTTQLVAPNGVLSDQKDSKVYFLLGWYYALLKERLQFVPRGLTRKYEFNEYDLAFAKAFIDRSIQNSDYVPWPTIAKFVGQIVFGGKVDDRSDLEFVESLAEKILSLDASLGDTNLLLTDEESLFAPEDIEEFIKKLPEVEPVTWIGLPESSAVELKEHYSARVTEQARTIFGDLC